MRKQFILAIGFFVFSLPLFSQNPVHVITGTVRDRSSKQPMEFATVQLLQISDSSIIGTTATDKKGKFVLDKIAAGNYILRFSFIGYEKTLVTVIVNQQKENIGIVE